MKLLLDNNLKQIESIVESMGESRFRAEQLYTAMLNGKDYSDKTNLPKPLLEKLKESGWAMQPLEITKQLKSKVDNNIKLLYKLTDGNIIEGMLMQYKFGNTLCLSTQVGCKMNCAFCASGLNGWIRNLTAGEMLGQVVAVNKLLGGTVKDRKITNIVLMGTGEPLDNFDNVVSFLKTLTSENGFNFSVRNISLSTCGIPSKIETLADLGLPITLCISLHAPNDAVRKTIMPIAKSYSIESVLESAKHYHTMTNRRIIIEYVLIDGVNNSIKDAKELSILLRELPCHVNLIRLNEVPERGLKAPSMKSCEMFLNNLHMFGVSATMRRTLGDDVEGACGMLRNKNLNENPLAKVGSKIDDSTESIREKGSLKKLSNNKQNNNRAGQSKMLADKSIDRFSRKSNGKNIDNARTQKGYNDITNKKSKSNFASKNEKITNSKKSQKNIKNSTKILKNNTKR